MDRSAAFKRRTDKSFNLIWNYNAFKLVTPLKSTLADKFQIIWE